MPSILTLFALLIALTASVGLWVGLRMLRPSVRSQVKRNAAVAGSWPQNILGTSPTIQGHETATCAGVKPDRKTRSLKSAARISDEALLDVTS